MSGQFPFVLYTYECSGGRVSCHVYGAADEPSAQEWGEKLKAAFVPAPNDPTATFNYSVVPLAGDQAGPWVVFSSIQGFGPADQAATGYADELEAYRGALAFAAPGGTCRIDGAALMVLLIESLPA